MSIAFFDLDKTLLAANSGSLWIRRELREGHLTRFEAARAALWILRYHLGFTSIEAALERAIASLRGSPAAPLRERTRRFYEEEVRAQFRKRGIEVLEEHRARGDRLVLLTSSSGYLSECVDGDLRFDALLCTRLELDAGGVHTGRCEGELCYASGKLRHAEACATAFGVSLSDCTFYTDSFADVSVLEKVGRPIVVNPDRRLRSHSLARRWPIVDWGAADPNALAGVVLPVARGVRAAS